MKIELVIAALVVALTGCTGSNRGKTVTASSEGPSQARVHAYNLTNDSPAAVISRNVENQDVMKPKDTLIINFTSPSRIMEPAFDQRVRDDGTITLIYNRMFQAAGKKTGELEKEILDYYVPTYFRSLTVTVHISSCTEFVYVDGEFRKPGRVSWTNGMRLGDVIEATGGFTVFGNRTIKILHEDGTVESYKLRGNWASTNNPILKPGDRIRNPRRIFKVPRGTGDWD
jgi:protein involved in polysaccharide export with SLBB domain